MKRPEKGSTSSQGNKPAADSRNKTCTEATSAAVTQLHSPPYKMTAAVTPYHTTPTILKSKTSTASSLLATFLLVRQRSVGDVAAPGCVSPEPAVRCPRRPLSLPSPAAHQRNATQRTPDTALAAQYKHTKRVAPVVGGLETNTAAMPTADRSAAAAAQCNIAERASNSALKPRCSAPITVAVFLKPITCSSDIGEAPTVDASLPLELRLPICRLSSTSPPGWWRPTIKPYIYPQSLSQGRRRPTQRQAG